MNVLNPLIAAVKVPKKPRLTIDVLKDYIHSDRTTADWPSEKDYLKTRTSSETTSVYRPIYEVNCHLQNKVNDTNTNLCLLWKHQKLNHELLHI
jgi:hypothetical protein